MAMLYKYSTVFTVVTICGTRVFIRGWSSVAQASPVATVALG